MICFVFKHYYHFFLFNQYSPFLPSQTQRHSAISISQNYTVTAKTSVSTRSQTYRPKQRKSKQSVYSCSLIVTLTPQRLIFLQQNKVLEEAVRHGCWYHRRTPADHWCGAAPRRAGHQRLCVRLRMVVHSAVNMGGTGRCIHWSRLQAANIMLPV